MKSSKLLINLPGDLKSWLRSTAHRRGVSMGALIRLLLAEQRADEASTWFDAPADSPELVQ